MGMGTKITVITEQPWPPPVYTCPYCGATFGSQAETNDHIRTVHAIEFGPDILVEGNASADSEWPDAGMYSADKACDDDTTTRWSPTNTPHPHWWKYDFGAGVTKIVTKLRIKPFWNGRCSEVKNFKLQGSNNDIDWTDIYAGQHGNNDNWEDFIFANDAGYRYYRVYLINNWEGSNYGCIWEIEMMEEKPPIGEVIPWLKRYAPYLALVGAIGAVITYFSLRK